VIFEEDKSQMAFQKLRDDLPKAKKRHPQKKKKKCVLKKYIFKKTI